MYSLSQTKDVQSSRWEKIIWEKIQSYQIKVGSESLNNIIVGRSTEITSGKSLRILKACIAPPSLALTQFKCELVIDKQDESSNKCNTISSWRLGAIDNDFLKRSTVDSDAAFLAERNST